MRRISLSGNSESAALAVVAKVWARSEEIRADGAAALHQVQCAIEVGFVLLVRLDGAMPEVAVGGVAGLIRDQDGQGDLALAEIVADGLAQHRLVRGVVQRIVHQLERDAQVHAEFGQRCRLGVGSVGHHGSDLACGGEQRGGLSADHVQIARLGCGQIVLGDELQDFALGDGRGGAREDGENLQRAILHHELEGSGEQEIADQDRGLIAEHRVRRCQPAAKQALVDHVVVQQRGGMDELDAGGELDVALASVAAQSCARERQQRAQPLPARGDDVGGELRNKRHRTVHPGYDGAVARLQVRLQHGCQGVQRVGNLSKLGSWLACLAATGTISARRKRGSRKAER